MPDFGSSELALSASTNGGEEYLPTDCFRNYYPLPPRDMSSKILDIMMLCWDDLDIG